MTSYFYENVVSFCAWAMDITTWILRGRGGGGGGGCVCLKVANIAVSEVAKIRHH